MTVAALFEQWDLQAPRSPHLRLEALLARDTDRQSLENDTLGARNRRILLLHRATIGAQLEAQSACLRCGTEVVFEVPVESILAIEPPDPALRVSVARGARSFEFRLPRMSDLRSAVEPRQLAACCSLDVDEPDLTEVELADLGRQFDARDPAADVVVRYTCAGCGHSSLASVDVATFVARDLDRKLGALLRDIDRIARAYGWSEREILQLPTARRRHYVALIAASATPPRASSRLGA